MKEDVFDAHQNHLNSQTYIFSFKYIYKYIFFKHIYIYFFKYNNKRFQTRPKITKKRWSGRCEIIYWPNRGWNIFDTLKKTWGTESTKDTAILHRVCQLPFLNNIPPEWPGSLYSSSHSCSAGTC